MAFGQLLLLIYITGKNFKTNVIQLLNERWVFGGRKNVPPRSAGRGMVMRVPAVGCTELETELYADFETGEVQLESCGAGGVGIVAGGEAGEAVAEIKADGIVGEAGGEAEVDFVVVLIARVVDRYGTDLGMGDFIVTNSIFVPTIGDIGTEIPVEAFAKQTAGDEAHTLEEFEGEFGEIVVFAFNIGGGDAEKVVETVGGVGVETETSVTVVETQTNAVRFGKSTH